MRKICNRFQAGKRGSSRDQHVSLVLAGANHLLTGHALHLASPAALSMFGCSDRFSKQSFTLQHLFKNGKKEPTRPSRMIQSQSGSNFFQPLA